MLPLSIWSWQNAVKAVLGGKAVVVETYPDVVIRAVSIDMPVPSVIALREYAPSGKLVSENCCIVSFLQSFNTHFHINQRNPRLLDAMFSCVMDTGASIVVDCSVQQIFLWITSNLAALVAN
jgi:hypothetical protein